MSDTPKGAPPERIFLQWDGDQEPDYLAEDEGITWAAHQIYQHDVEYARADKLTAAQAEIAELRATIRENIATIKTLSEQVGAKSANPGGSLHGWVRCEDRLPELGEIVWLWEEKRGPWIGSRDMADSDCWLWGNAYGKIWHNGVKWDAEVEQDDDYHPTHWKPLPLLPNVANPGVAHEARLKILDELTAEAQRLGLYDSKGGAHE